MSLQSIRRVVTRVVLPLVLAWTAAGQKYSFRTYSEAEGLTDSTVNAMLQDQNGFLWVATTDGVFHFDGARFRRYGVEEGLPSASVSGIFERRNGEILVLTSARVERLVGDTFEPLSLSSGHSVLGSQVLAEDAAGRLYVATRHGLYWASGGSKGIVPGTEGRPLWSVFSQKGPVIWYALPEAICSWDGERSRCRGADAGVAPDQWGGLTVDHDGAVWARSAARLLTLPAGGTKFVARDNALPTAYMNGALSLDSRGSVMAPTLSGLARWTGDGWSILRAADGLPVPTVISATEDREGSLWIGTRGGGLARWLGSGEWETWTGQQGLGSDDVLALASDERHGLLIGTGAGLASLKDGKISILPMGTTENDTGRVRSIAVDREGGIWLSTMGPGVRRIDPRTGRVRFSGNEPGSPMRNILTIATGPDGVVWAGGKEERHPGYANAGQVDMAEDAAGGGARGYQHLADSYRSRRPCLGRHFPGCGAVGRGTLDQPRSGTRTA